MLRRVVICLIVAIAGSLFGGTADARQRIRSSPPFSHAPSACWMGRPCTPRSAACSITAVHSRDRLSLWREPQLTVEAAPSHDDTAKYKADHDLDTIGDLFAALRSAGRRRRLIPRGRHADDGAVSASNEPARSCGPALTYATAGVSPNPHHLPEAINASLDACEPLKFTSGLGGALAGRADRDPLCR